MPAKKLDPILPHVKWVQDHLQLVRWDRSQYMPLYGQRTVQQIMESRETNYVSPCLDLSTLMCYRLRENGFKPVLVAHEVISPYTHLPVPHFAVETQIGKTWVTIDFKTGKTALVYPGRYKPEKSLPENPHLGIKRFPAAKIGLKTTPLKLLKIFSWRQTANAFGFLRFPHLAAAAKQMKKADSPELFHKTRRIRPTILRV